MLRLNLFAGRDSQLRSSFYSPLNSMWQAATLGGPKPYSSASSLPGFYSTGYPPTPPKDSQTDEPPAPPRAAASNSEEYINSSLSSSISSEDLMSNDMKPTPESLMGFHSFPYSSRKIQEGRLSDCFYFYFLFFILFYFILFHFILFYFILFYFILFYFIFIQP